MISRRILLAAVCFAVLFGAFGAYGYSEISSLKGRIDTLRQQVSDLEAERDELQEEIARTNSTKTFVFEWGPELQNITKGTLCMELAFTWKEGENLFIIGKINDDDYDEVVITPSYRVVYDSLAFVFDFDGDGQLEGETAYILYGDNTTILGGFSRGRICIECQIGEPSDFHTSVFEPGVGYTFNCSIPVCYVHSDLVYVRYLDGARWLTPPLEFVYVCFHFGTPLEAS